MNALEESIKHGHKHHCHECNRKVDGVITIGSELDVPAQICVPCMRRIISFFNEYERRLKWK